MGHFNNWILGIIFPVSHFEIMFFKSVESKVEFADALGVVPSFRNSTKRKCKGSIHTERFILLFQNLKFQ